MGLKTLFPPLPPIRPRTLVQFTSAFFLATLCFPPKIVDDNILHTQATLAAFTQRGQMSVEPALPLLSTLIPADGNLFLEILLFVACKAVAFAILRKWPLVVAFAVILACRWELGQGGLSLSYGFGHAAVILGLLGGERWVWSEGLVAVGFAFGYSELEACVAYLLLFGQRVAGLWKRVADPEISCRSLVLSALGGLFLWLVFWPTVFLITTGFLLPDSEGAAGGNYNLRYLSPVARRNITPFGSITTMPDRPAPFGIVDSTEMYTLYLPGAGFLSSDEMVWAQSVPDQEEDAVEGSERVFFQDKFTERYPWTVQAKNPLQGKKKWSKQGVIRSGSQVQIRSWTSNDYLCVIPGERVVSEAGWFEEAEKKKDSSETEKSEIQRIRVGTLPTPCDWTVYYDLLQDSGVIFYQPENACRLATTYHSLPNEATNDTIRQTLGSQIEASCTTNANDASSRLCLIDGSPVTDKPSSHKLEAYDVGLLQRCWRLVQRSWSLLEARKAVSVFRSRHASISEPVLEGQVPSSKPSYYFAHALLAVSLMRCLIRQRHPATRVQGAPLWQTIFVMIQVLSGASMSRVVGMVSLHGLTS